MGSEPEGIEPTNTDLLIALKDLSNDRLWTTFCERYRPVLLAFGRRLGLSEHDALDAAQETLSAFACSYRRGDYDREKGRLRTWLFRIASHKVRDIQRANYRQPVSIESQEGTRWADRVPDVQTMSELWEIEWRKAVLDACLDEVYRQVEPTTIRAFVLYILEDWPVDKVAEHLGMTRNAVFKAQRRVMTRLRERYQCLNDNG